MLSSDDLAQMQTDLAAVRGDREESITIRRGDSTLGAQNVRIARVRGSGRRVDSDRGQEIRGQVIVMGGVDLDIAPGDRFNDGEGDLYRVVFVRPNQSAAVTAEAEIVE